MKCREIMKADVECLRESDSVANAAQKMKMRNVGFLPVCDEQSRVLGTITDRDIALRVVAERGSFDQSVQEVMSREAVICSPDDDVRTAEEQMSRHQKSRIMCVDADGKLCGVISLSDIAKQEGSARRARNTMAEVAAREVR